MERLKFEEFRKELVRKADEISRTKGHDYSGEMDVFASLKRNADALGLKVDVLILAQFQKHVDALYTFGRKGELRSEQVDERIADTVNFLLLLYAWQREVACVRCYGKGKLVGEGGETECHACRGRIDAPDKA